MISIDKIEAAAKACFGVWRERPRLPQAEIDRLWDEIDESFKTAWRETAIAALEAASAIDGKEKG